MKARLLALAARFDGLARRERMLVAAAVIVVITFLGYSLVFDPAIGAAQADAKRAQQARADLARANGELAALQNSADPDAANRKALEAARAQLAVGDVKLRAMEATMVPPDKMRAFVESLLARHRQVEVVGLRTLPPSPVFETTAAELAAPVAEALGPNIYKHGVEIKIAGQYNDLLAYLAELERMPQRILWNKVVLTAETYPRSVLTVTVYTLSLDKQWLTI